MGAAKSRQPSDTNTRMYPANSFSVLTYNINDDALSESAPKGWSLGTQHGALRDLILRHSPDLLCLQECFSFPARLKGHYTIHGQARSHRGDCCIATRKGGALQPDGPAIRVGPCVLLPLRLGERRLHVACAHLAPFGEFAPQRAAQVAQIVSTVPPGAPLLLAGDLNMREKETSVAGEHGLMDAWIEAGSPPEQRWTWDTRANRYYKDGAAYTARYDRLLYRGCGVEELAVAANEPASEAPAHFLSDHFALTARVVLTG